MHRPGLQVTALQLNSVVWAQHAARWSHTLAEPTHEACRWPPCAWHRSETHLTAEHSEHDVWPVLSKGMAVKPLLQSRVCAPVNPRQQLLKGVMQAGVHLHRRQQT